LLLANTLFGWRIVQTSFLPAASRVFDDRPRLAGHVLDTAPGSRGSACAKKMSKNLKKKFLDNADDPYTGIQGVGFGVESCGRQDRG